MLNVIYTIKACMLIMYTRLTLGLTTQRLVTYLSIYVFLGWIATETAFFTACRPFTGYWAMPPPNPQCTTLQNYAIVQACFNISSDVLMLLIPLPLVTRLVVPWRQKAILLVIFSMGIFVIAAAILTKVFNLGSVYDPGYMLWYTRESSVAVYVSNIPLIWPLLREWFPALPRGGKSSSQKASGYALGSTVRGGVVASGNVIQQGRWFSGRRLEIGGGGIITTVRAKGDSVEEFSSGDEMELVSGMEDESWGGRRSDGWGDTVGRGGIHKLTTVQISEEHIQPVRMPSRTFTPVSNGEQELWDMKKGKAF